MDKRTLLAIALSVVVVAGSFLIQNTFWPAKPQVAPTTTAAPEKKETAAVATSTGEMTLTPATQDVVLPQKIAVETDLFKITLSNEGAVITSLELKKHSDNGKPVQMVNSEWGAGSAFETSFGSFDREAAKIPFAVAQINAETYEFTKQLVDRKGNPFLFKKTYTIKKDEYVIRLDLTTESTNGALPVLSDDSYAYTLTFGPQIGPSFKKLDGQQEYRKYYRFDGNNRPDESLNNETKTNDNNWKWTAIVGKYFTVIGIPDSTNYRSIFSNKRGPADHEVSRMAFSRPILKSSTTKDTFFFYVGPKDENSLKRYDDASTNGFGLSGLKLERAMEDNFLLGWLEFILKLGLEGFIFLIPNWGVAIILLTLVIKLATWPLTAKSYQASAAMQTLQPKLKELQEKYKDDPKKLNEATMGLYQKEGVNPLGGCLPMLLQIPVFFALYSLFNNQFDLRGALFIPGWIPDLSLPDVVLHWGFQLPLLNWSSLHVLPFIMVGTQIWTSMLSQPTGGMNGQMKVMTFGIPVLFFFMLYEMPSGLMVYWCVQNILTVVQQAYVNKHFKKPAAQPAKKAKK